MTAPAPSAPHVPVLLAEVLEALAIQPGEQLPVGEVQSVQQGAQGQVVGLQGAAP